VSLDSNILDHLFRRTGMLALGFALASTQPVALVVENNPRRLTPPMPDTRVGKRRRRF
jgi:hypothetical protein